MPAKDWRRRSTTLSGQRPVWAKTRGGGIHSLFATLAAPVYKWERLNRILRRWIGIPVTVEGRPEMEKADLSKKQKGRRKLRSGALR